MKGDGQHPLFEFELKRDKRDRIEVGDAVLGKLCLEARRLGKDPALVVTMDGLSAPTPQDWVCVPVETFKYLLSLAERDSDGDN